MRKFFNKDTIRVDYLTLKIKDIKTSLDFYLNKLGLTLIKEEAKKYYLGVGNNVLIILVEDKNAKAKERTTGLYHFALLLPNRKYLGQLINHFIKVEQPIVGGSDHGVSEALYLNDPDGNGIEIYADNNSDEWEFIGDEVVMLSDPLDYRSLIQDAYQKVWTEMPSETIIGHVHYHVATIAEASHFFIDVIGLNEMLMYGDTAMFLSSDEYHHHLGINTWAGQNVLNRPDEMIGLVSYHLNTGNNRENLILRINEHHIEIKEDNIGTFIYDVNNVKVYFW